MHFRLSGCLSIASALLCFSAGVASAEPQQEATSEKEARLSKLLKDTPEADRNGDGILTLTEAKAFLKLRRQSGDRVGGSSVTVPAPTFSNVAYGPDEAQRFDLWQAESPTPTPLVVCIHGGGFKGGDKSKYHNEPVVTRLLDAGISVATLNYRLTEVGKNPYPAAMHDCARAVQTLRARASQFHLDPDRVAATGGSAGGCISLWLAFHDDLADPNADDPIARQSTRLTCAAPVAVPTSLEAGTLHAWFETPTLKEHPATRALFGLPATGPVDLKSPELTAITRDASPISHLTPDDPPVYLTYGGSDTKVDAQTEPGTWVHHPRTGIRLKEQMDQLGVACYLEYRGFRQTAAYANSTDFLIDLLNSAATKAVRPAGSTSANEPDNRAAR